MGGKGSGGKNRKPTAQKKAEGNRGKRAINEKEPAVLPGEPPMPSGITADPKAVWPEVCAILRSHGVLYQTHGIAVAALCSNLVRFWQADAAVQKYGSIVAEVESQTGVATISASPAVKVRSDALKNLRASWQGFGLDPASNAGVTIPDNPEKPKSGLDAVLRAKSAKDEIVH